MLRAAESSGFEIRDVENLREHYALTLRHWLRRLEAHHDEDFLALFSVWLCIKILHLMVNSDIYVL